MRCLKIAVVTGFLTATASAASAADPRVVLPPAPAIEDSHETWYLRGDIGYVDHKRPEADFTADPFMGSLIREGIADSGMVGIGVGYRFSPHFRADVTVDHRFNTRLKGVAPTPAFATASIMDTGLFQSSTLMLNGYVDLGTAGGFTPYLGAGFGIASNVISNFARTTNDAVADITSWERIAGGNDYSFAWALMAGVAYQLSSSFTLDLGYRYLSLGDVKTRNYVAGTGADIESIGAHEVRLGVRYAFR